MIESYPAFQGMLELNRSIQTLYELIKSLPDSKDEVAENWVAIEVQLDVIEQLIQQLRTLDSIVEQSVEASDWERWIQLKTQTKDLHTQALDLLIIKKEQFYREVQSVGQSVKAHRAYNEMKRIRF